MYKIISKKLIIITIHHYNRTFLTSICILVTYYNFYGCFSKYFIFFQPIHYPQIIDSLFP